MYIFLHNTLLRYKYQGHKNKLILSYICKYLNGELFHLINIDGDGLVISNKSKSRLRFRPVTTVNSYLSGQVFLQPAAHNSSRAHIFLHALWHIFLEVFYTSQRQSSEHLSLPKKFCLWMLRLCVAALEILSY